MPAIASSGMTTSVTSRNENNSLIIAINYARDLTIKGDGQIAREQAAQKIWTELYCAVPSLNSSHKERQKRKLPALQGNPDPAKGLLEHLAQQGLPRCVPTARITHAALWTLRELNILTEHARQDADAILYEQTLPVMHFADGESEQKWYEENIKFKYETIKEEEHGKTIQHIYPKETQWRSQEVQARQEFIKERKPKSNSHYLWKFSQDHWKANAKNFDAAFKNYQPFITSNLEQALRHRRGKSYK